MRKFRFALLFALLLAPLAAAQTTQVTGTVLDANALPYAGASMKVGLVFAGTPVSNPTVTISVLSQCQANGFGSAPCQVPFNPSNGPFSLDGSGNIPGGGITLQDNALVTPAGTQWAFTVNTPGNPPPIGTGPQTCTAPLTITGGSQSVSASFAACPKLSNSSGTGTQLLNAVSCTGCKADLQAVFDATVTNGSTAIATTAGDVAFTSADNLNKTCFATAGGGSGLLHVAGKLATGSGIAGEGTLIVLTAHTATCSVAGNANATGAASNTFLWATNDSNAMATAYALAAPATGVCGTLIMPAHPFLVDTNFGSGVADTCAIKITGPGNEGLSVFGLGQLSSLMTVGPNFDPSTCPASTFPCFFNAVGNSMYNFGIWGVERSDCPVGFNGKHFLALAQDTHIVNVEGLGWCANSQTGTVLTDGILETGASAAQQAGMIIDGFGTTALHITVTGAPITNSWFGDQQLLDVSIDSGVTWFSNENTFGDVSTNGIMVQVSGTFMSTGDFCYNALSNSLAAVKVPAGGLANLSGFNCRVNTNATSVSLWATGGRINVTNSVIQGGVSAEDALIDNSTGSIFSQNTAYTQGAGGTNRSINRTAGTFFDLHGNSYTQSIATIAPTCAATTGGTACSVVAGSTNERGTVRITASAVATGTVTLTFAGTFTYTTALPIMAFNYVNSGGTGSWSLTSTTPIVLTTRSTTAPVFNWNQTGALTAASTYDIDYVAVAR